MISQAIVKCYVVFSNVLHMSFFVLNHEFNFHLAKFVY